MILCRTDYKGWQEFLRPLFAILGQKYRTACRHSSFRNNVKAVLSLPNFCEPTAMLVLSDTSDMGEWQTLQESILFFNLLFPETPIILFMPEAPQGSRKEIDKLMDRGLLHCLYSDLLSQDEWCVRQTAEIIEDYLGN